MCCWNSAAYQRTSVYGDDVVIVVWLSSRKLNNLGIGLSLDNFVTMSSILCIVAGPIEVLYVTQRGVASRILMLMIF